MSFIYIYLYIVSIMLPVIYSGIVSNPVAALVRNVPVVVADIPPSEMCGPLSFGSFTTGQPMSSTVRSTSA
ncbi:hypothetical protein BDF22DRAFT_670400 [Syncephalis plumigaleata]|nr:hypothetical protein BDF22DRAFT_670400 [Syncephalis plumigaleata]